MRLLLSALVALLPLLASAAIPAPPAKTETAIFAGGCFWCTEADFEKMPGVVSATSGYIGGSVKNPTYEQVSGGSTGHTEAVQVVFDPSVVSYAQLVEKFWLTIDPVAQNRQFCDHGTQYRSGIYPLNAEQMKVAQASKAALVNSGRLPAVHTEVVAAGPFWPAEAYHQDYYKTNALRYQYYRFGCGRDARLEQLWGKPAK